MLGVTDDEYGEVLAAFVSGSASEDEVIKGARRSSRLQGPEEGRKLDELPRTSTGKILSASSSSSWRRRAADES